MDFFDVFHTSASGLTAQKLRMNLISSNLANINTTRTPQGGPYRRKQAVFATQSPIKSFKDILASRQGSASKGVEVVDIIEDPSPPLKKYDPNHPDADEQGYVAMPSINIMEEMIDLISATRSYEANIMAIKASKSMVLKALEIGR
jgi:flagellar basal-body rod protein FlgC